MTFRNLAIIGEKVLVGLIGVVFIAVMGALLVVDMYIMRWVMGM